LGPFEVSASGEPADDSGEATCRDALGNSVIGAAMGRTAAVDHTHFL
jgi:hypothetical protein